MSPILSILSIVIMSNIIKRIGLHHPLDGVTNPEYKLLRFIQLIIFLQREEGTSF